MATGRARVTGFGLVTKGWLQGIRTRVEAIAEEASFG